MSERLWGTQEDVLKDLEEVYGMRISANQRDMFVQGEGPPPPMATDEDDLQDTFDGLQDYIAPPDLKGITQMLKIVKEHEKEDDHDDLPITGQTNQRVHHIITISKLNPNVPSFVPNTDKKLILTNGTSKNADLNDENECNNLKDNVKQGENVKICANAEQSVNENSSISSSSDPNKISNDEREKLAEQLKNKICNNAKVDTLQSKKEKNIAISSLLKLYSKPQLNKSETPKLITPDYYAKSKAEITKPIDETVAVNNKCEMIVSNSPEPKENKPEDITPSEDIHATNVEIEQSIKKVNNWLNPRTPTPKKQSVYLGPLSFKRKETSACKSPNSSSENTLSKCSTSTTTEYKPSEYADELVKKYSERQRELEAAELKAMDPMTKLELELKARDKIIRQRALEKSASKVNRQ